MPREKIEHMADFSEQINNIELAERMLSLEIERLSDKVNDVCSDELSLNIKLKVSDWVFIYNTFLSSHDYRITNIIKREALKKGYNLDEIIDIKNDISCLTKEII